jgi:hypothetical protein
VHPFIHLERQDKDNPENDLRSLIEYLARPVARGCEQCNEDFRNDPYVCERLKEEFEIHDRPLPPDSAW